MPDDSVQLTVDIAAFIAAHNAEPKPFRWTKSADDILASIERTGTGNDLDNFITGNFGANTLQWTRQ